MSSGRPFGSLLAMIRLWAWSASYPLGTILALVMVVARALSQSISWVSQSISSLMPFLHASSRLSASTTVLLVHRDEILTLDHELGHWDFSCWMIPMP